MELKQVPLITNDAVVFGILMVLLGAIFASASSDNSYFKRFYSLIPTLLLCYFLPSLMTTLGVIAPEWHDIPALIEHMVSLGHQVSASTSIEELSKLAEGLEEGVVSGFVVKSQLYFVASRYLLPASLVLLTLSIDLSEIIKLGPKALIMFFTGTVGVVIGGPLAILLIAQFSPETVGVQNGEEVWRGMTTVAGSWIGGGANQAAMYEIFKEGDKELISGNMYSVMITIDIIVAEVWMFFLLLGVGRSDKIDKFFRADASAVERLKQKMQAFTDKITRVPTFTDLMVILGLALGATALSHLVADNLAPFIKENYPILGKFSLTSGFFWLIVTATTVGLILSFTKARNYEGAGASKVGSVFIYILVATIGMKMNVIEIIHHYKLFLVGGVWMLIHVGLLFLVGALIRAPFFFLAVGSKANIGGAASAPVVAAAFHPSLAPVGVLLAVLGYALGTYGAWICGILMQGAAGG